MFATTFGSESTNKAAERALCLAVLWCKGGFETRSTDGSRFVECRAHVDRLARRVGSSGES
jgi:hypothetical protein